MTAVDESSDAFRKGVREHLESHAYLLAKGEDKIIVSANSFQSVNEEIATYIDHFSNKQYNVSLSTRKLESVDEIDEGDRDEASYGCLQLIGSSVKQYLAEFFSASSTVIGMQ